MLKGIALSLFPSAIRTSLAGWRFHATKAWGEFQHQADMIGVNAAISLWVGKQLGAPSRRVLRRLWLRGFHYPLYYRPGTSDPDVILQVFARREYEACASERDVRLIIDCGANIGCT